MHSLTFDVAHLLAGTMLVLSFTLLYQDRVTAVLNVFALQAIALALSVAWQSIAQNAPHLIVTALVALVVKGFVIPMALHRIVRRLGIHREIEQVIGGGPTMLTGLLLVALSILLVEPVGESTGTAMAGINSRTWTVDKLMCGPAAPRGSCRARSRRRCRSARECGRRTPRTR